MSFYDTLRGFLEREEPAAIVTVISGDALGTKILVPLRGDAIGTLGREELDRSARDLALRGIENNQSFTGQIDTEGEPLEVFVEVHAPRPQLVIVGAVHTAIHLVNFARELGFKTIVVDARSAFASEERFPHADELIVEWPADALEKLAIHPETYFAFLSHDPKLDDPALVVALASPARYVGALGSKKTHQKRRTSLAELGVEEQSIDRIHNPIGLKLGGRRPQDIALGIAAQLIQARHGNA